MPTKEKAAKVAATKKSPMSDRNEVKGLLRDFNLSPKGRIEGFLLTVENDSLVQINTDPEVGARLAQLLEPGEHLKIEVKKEKHADHHESSSHPVFRFVSLLGDEKKIISTKDNREHKGVVVRLNYALHGEPNGVVLDNGIFVHLKPDGMRKVKLEKGSHVDVIGDLRPSVIGSGVIEPERINGTNLTDKKKH